MEQSDTAFDDTDTTLDTPDAFAAPIVTFAKIVANPTPTSWSQAYNAGGLFAVLSLSHNASSENESDIPSLGKELLNTLEEEFFTLEEKNMESIKQAVSIACQKIPADKLLQVCFAVASIPQALSPKKDAVLYTFMLGHGQILLHRNGKTGIVQKGSEALTTSSGFLENNDLIILETAQFKKNIPTNMLFTSPASSYPETIAENLAPEVHQQEEGGSSAIIILYKKPNHQKQTEKVVSEANNPIPDTKEAPQTAPTLKQRIPKPNLTQYTARIASLMPRTITLNHSKKVFLTIAILLCIIFATSIHFATKKQENQKTQVLFESIYTPAQKKYDEGKAIIGLNKNIARDDFTQAVQILKNGQTKLSTDSTEYQKITALLKKVEDALVPLSDTNASLLQAVTPEKNPLLAAELKNGKNTSPSFYTKDEKNIYMVDNKTVSSLDTSTQKPNTLIANNNDWGVLGGFGTYNGNMYLLDKSAKQIQKFVPVDNGFSKTNYLTSTLPQLEHAVSMTIDTSIWVLLKDGTVLKFTRGNKDDFTLTGLNRPLTHPTRIFTSTDTNNLYIVDNGNKRIVVFGKNGAYATEYQSPLLEQAKDIAVVEKDKQIFVLIDNKIYQIDLK